jgi:hypothetical protein
MGMLVDWKRLEKFVFQECRQSSVNPEIVMDSLRSIVSLCGESVQSRQALVRIARALVATNCAPLVVAPCCPDYTHEGGKYNFHSLRGGVSLLTSLHIQFLKPLSELLPDASVKILLADQEADDEALCRACNKTQTEFKALVRESIAATLEVVADHGWGVIPFTQFMPDLLVQERQIAEGLLKDRSASQRLSSEMFSRQEMYYRIGRFSAEEMMLRTARTAAQYLALGRQVRSESGMILNHTTTNLAWYAEADVAVMHNPVCVY